MGDELADVISDLAHVADELGCVVHETEQLERIVRDNEQLRAENEQPRTQNGQLMVRLGHAEDAVGSLQRSVRHLVTEVGRLDRSTANNSYQGCAGKGGGGQEKEKDWAARSVPAVPWHGVQRVGQEEGQKGGGMEGREGFHATSNVSERSKEGKGAGRRSAECAVGRTLHTREISHTGCPSLSSSCVSM